MKTRGGKRENAGRKAGKRRKRCTVDMLPDTWAAIDQRRGKLSRGRFIETVIENDKGDSQSPANNL